jgi:hypothetical protein
MLAGFPLQEMIGFSFCFLYMNIINIGVDIEEEMIKISTLLMEIIMYEIEYLQP